METEENNPTPEVEQKENVKKVRIHLLMSYEHLSLINQSVSINNLTNFRMAGQIVHEYDLPFIDAPEVIEFGMEVKDSGDIIFQPQIKHTRPLTTKVFGEYLEDPPSSKFKYSVTASASKKPLSKKPIVYESKDPLNFGRLYREFPGQPRLEPSYLPLLKAIPHYPFELDLRKNLAIMQTPQGTTFKLPDKPYPSLASLSINKILHDFNISITNIDSLEHITEKLSKSYVTDVLSRSFCANLESLISHGLMFCIPPRTKYSFASSLPEAEYKKQVSGWFEQEIRFSPEAPKAKLPGYSTLPLDKDPINLLSLKTLCYFLYFCSKFFVPHIKKNLKEILDLFTLKQGLKQESIDMYNLLLKSLSIFQHKEFFANFDEKVVLWLATQLGQIILNLPKEIIVMKLVAALSSIISVAQIEDPPQSFKNALTTYKEDFSLNDLEVEILVN